MHMLSHYHVILRGEKWLMPRTWKVPSSENKLIDKSEIDKFECFTLANFTCDARETQTFVTLPLLCLQQVILWLMLEAHIIRMWAQCMYCIDNTVCVKHEYQSSLNWTSWYIYRVRHIKWYRAIALELLIISKNVSDKSFSVQEGRYTRTPYFLSAEALKLRQRQLHFFKWNYVFFSMTLLLI